MRLIQYDADSLLDEEFLDWDSLMAKYDPSKVNWIDIEGLGDVPLLERVAERINATVKLPHDIELVGSQCGEANAYWNFAEKKITICYEDADLSMRSFQRAGDPDPIPAAINAIPAAR
jgi:hypothetical protein